jgi:hypothetical protein
MRRVVLAVALISGCGEISYDGTVADPSPDAGVGSDVGSGSSAPGFACRNKVANVGSGNHHPGEDCQGGCHNHGFTLAGTIFAQPGSTVPLVGATITVLDAAGKTFDLPSQRNGNFYTAMRVTFPVTVTASACPDVAPMVTHLTATMDGCNQGGCHVAGAQGVIHLP